MRFLLFALCLSAYAQQDAPTAEIKTQAITAKFYLPDPDKGYYRGTRFDWSGQISSLRTKNHEYFGQWFPKYDPKLHDAIMGPVEEFKSEDGGLGYADAKPGGVFIRIGVGVVRKPEEKAYQGFRTYEIVDHGKWTVKQGKDWIRFTHQLKGPYSYEYTKTIRFAKKDAKMRIEHALKNTGDRAIRTQQYNHNFFVIDGQPTGPATRIQFPFDLKPIRNFANDTAVAAGKEIKYTRELTPGLSTYGEFEGFSKSPSDYDLRLENSAAKAGVRIRGDVPLAKVVYWSIRTVFSPEPYINIDVAPGKVFRWKYDYEFYDLP